MVIYTNIMIFKQINKFKALKIKALPFKLLLKNHNSYFKNPIKLFLENEF